LGLFLGVLQDDSRDLTEPGQKLFIRNGHKEIAKGAKKEMLKRRKGLLELFAHFASFAVKGPTCVLRFKSTGA